MTLKVVTLHAFQVWWWWWWYGLSEKSPFYIKARLSGFIKCAEFFKKGAVYTQIWHSPCLLKPLSLSPAIASVKPVCILIWPPKLLISLLIIHNAESMFILLPGTFPCNTVIALPAVTHSNSKLTLREINGYLLLI